MHNRYRHHRADSMKMKPLNLAPGFTPEPGGGTLSVLDIQTEPTDVELVAVCATSRSAILYRIPRTMLILPRS